jgi:ribose 5-phosphate isomerase B
MNHPLYIASDHAGFDLKRHLISVLKDEYDVIDCGPKSLDKHDDYPDYAKILCKKVLEQDARGILICDTGVGMCIAANRYPGIRAALVTTPFMAERAREHNDANIICLGQDVVSQEENVKLVRTWLRTGFTQEERHIRRLQKLDNLG